MSDPLPAFADIALATDETDCPGCKEAITWGWLVHGVRIPWRHPEHAGRACKRWHRYRDTIPNSTELTARVA